MQQKARIAEKAELLRSLDLNAIGNKPCFASHLQNLGLQTEVEEEMDKKIQEICSPNFAVVFCSVQFSTRIWGPCACSQPLAMHEESKMTLKFLKGDVEQ